MTDSDHRACETQYVDANTAYCKDCETHIPIAHAFGSGGLYDD